jgi:Tfp pilus assembly protein PilX
MKILLFIALALSIQATALAASGFSTLEERMTGKEFQDTGLSKLTESELAALNEWIRRHSEATLENASAPTAASAEASGPKGDLRGFANRPKNDGLDDVITATIVGTFDGWVAKGDLFKLNNGMIWQQDERSAFSMEPVQNAQVTISKNLFGNWHMSVAGHDKKVQVIRIQ